MQRSILSLAGAIVICAPVIGIADHSRSETSINGPTTVDFADVPAAMAAMAPADEHKALEHFVGRWRGPLQRWAPGAPSGDANPNSGDMTATMWMDGRWLRIEYFEDGSDEPYMHTLIGYDGLREHYVAMTVGDWYTTPGVATGLMVDGVLTFETTWFATTVGEPIEVVDRSVITLDGDILRFALHEAWGGVPPVRSPTISTFRRVGKPND